MAIDFSDKRVTMVVCPVDGRYGFYALSDLAFKLLHIDIYKQEDYVVFVSRSRGICKIICTDECGTTLITRRLHKGRFEPLKSSKAPTNYFTPNILRKSWSRLVVSVVHLDALAFPVAAT